MYNFVHFWLFLIQFFSHVLTGPTSGQAANTNLTNARWMGPSLMEWWCFTVQWSVRQPRARNLEPLRLRGPTERATDYWAAFNPFCGGRVCRGNSKVPVINTHIVSVTKSLNMNVRNVSRLDVFINELWIMRNLLWTIMNFLNYYEVIEVIELWTYSVSDEVTEHEREERRADLMFL